MNEFTKTLLVVAPEAPWPATHGGRVDVWNRYLGLKREGWNLALVFWSHNEETNENDRAILANVFSLIKELQLKPSLSAQARRLSRMLREPSQIAKRHVRKDTFFDIMSQIRPLTPDAVISEGLQGVELAKRISSSLRVPLFVRSHNIEHKYMATQLRLAKGVKQRLEIGAALLHLKRFEFASLRAAQAVLDISEEDAEFWRNQGLQTVHWVPPVFPDLQGRKLSVAWAERLFDVGYLGNLWAPNNVSAVEWFLSEILPSLRAARPSISVMVAGSKVQPELASKLNSTPNLTFIPNPPDASKARAQARVLINPIREGSGINTKSVEMLFADSPVVVTPFAVAGMSSRAAEAFDIAEDAEDFARRVLARLQSAYIIDDNRLYARDCFGQGGIKQISEILSKQISVNSSRTGSIK
jgi:hypothetical protein